MLLPLDRARTLLCPLTSCTLGSWAKTDCLDFSGDDLVERMGFRLFIINGGQAVFIRLVFAKNSTNGANTDVPSQFYLRLWRRGD